jgi:hypothetical protein
MKQPEVPFLALGINFDYGFLFSRVITSTLDSSALFDYMEKEAGSEIHSILMIKDDQVVGELEDPRP